MKNTLIFFIIFSFSPISWSSGLMHAAMNTLEHLPQTIENAINPSVRKCSHQLITVQKSTLLLTDLFPKKAEREERIVSADELLNHIKDRLYAGNHEGKDQDVRCTVEIEKNEKGFDLVIMSGNASVEKYPVNTEVLKKLPPSEEARISIKSTENFKIETTNSTEVVDSYDIDIRHDGYELIVERISTQKGIHLFFSVLSPNFPGHHIFQHDFFSCYFKAALY